MDTKILVTSFSQFQCTRVDDRLVRTLFRQLPTASVSAVSVLIIAYYNLCLFKQVLIDRAQRGTGHLGADYISNNSFLTSDEPEC